jgi:hypothetical protein
VLVQPLPSPVGAARDFVGAGAVTRDGNREGLSVSILFDGAPATEIDGRGGSR